MIQSVWTFKGAVFFKKFDSCNDFGQKVEHIEDIKYYIFQLENFESDE